MVLFKAPHILFQRRHDGLDDWILLADPAHRHLGLQLSPVLPCQLRLRLDDAFDLRQGQVVAVDDQLLQEGDPVRIRKIQIEPSVDQRVVRGQELAVVADLTDYESGKVLVFISRVKRELQVNQPREEAGIVLGDRDPSRQMQ